MFVVQPEIKEGLVHPFFFFIHHKIFLIFGGLKEVLTPFYLPNDINSKLMNLKNHQNTGQTF